MLYFLLYQPLAKSSLPNIYISCLFCIFLHYVVFPYSNSDFVSQRAFCNIQRDFSLLRLGEEGSATDVLLVEARDVAKHTKMHRIPSYPQRIIWPQMPVVIIVSLRNTAQLLCGKQIAGLQERKPGDELGGNGCGPGKR